MTRRWLAVRSGAVDPGEEVPGGVAEAGGMGDRVVTSVPLSSRLER